MSRAEKGKKKEINKPKKVNKKPRRVVFESSTSSESESASVPLQSLSKKKVTEKGCYVIVKYEGEFFPGLVENKEEGLFEISTMVLCSANSFKWPEKPDKIWYRERDFTK